MTGFASASAHPASEGENARVGV
ncbi:MAG: hypothetical protein RLZZ494_279, partial [Pseudomonadota bacterium]